MTSELSTGSMQNLTSILATATPVTVVYCDASGDQENPGRFAELRARGIAARLEDRGAPQGDVAVVEETLSRPTGAPSPVSRFLVVRDGEVLADEVLAGEHVMPERLTHGRAPDLTPLLRHRPLDAVFVVARVQRGDAHVAVHRTAQVAAVAEEHLEGREDALHKFSGGGWSHLRYQRHTEEVWRQNEAEVASTIEKLVADHSPTFVVVAGDPRAIGKLRDELSEPAASLTTMIEANVSPEGSSDDELERGIDRLIREHVDGERRRVLDLLLAGGPGSRTTATGIGETVAALQQSQVDVLVLGAPSEESETVLALDGAPWVATSPEQAFDAEVIGAVPADAGLARAALLTDARVVFLTDDDRPRDDDRLRAESYAGDEPAADLERDIASVRTPAAVLRWPVGPDTAS